MDNIIASIREHIMKCPLMENERVNVDYVGTDMSYSIDPLPCDPVIQRYTDGGVKKQFQFALTSNEAYDEDARVNIENSGFYEAFEDWLEKQNLKDDLPDLPKGKTAVVFETLNKGYLYDTDGNLARYRVECRLIYTQEV
ncbi:hypothetical protein C808_05372 [Lachnospiraceae bacterium M18-1]|nr:hypothetical protein C808_05372 [Lachnospiraceae bacterium M18-1]